MRRAVLVATHPLTWMAATLSLNLYNDRHGKPTMCGTTRRVVPWPLFCLFWAALTRWMLPHYCRPLMKRVREELGS